MRMGLVRCNVDLMLLSLPIGRKMRAVHLDRRKIRAKPARRSDFFAFVNMLILPVADRPPRAPDPPLTAAGGGGKFQDSMPPALCLFANSQGGIIRSHYSPRNPIRFRKAGIYLGQNYAFCIDPLPAGVR